MSRKKDPENHNLLNFLPRFFSAISKSQFGHAGTVLSDTFFGRWVNVIIERALLWQPGFILIFALVIIYLDMNLLRPNVRFIDSIVSSFSAIGYESAIDKIDFSFLDHQISTSSNEKDAVNPKPTLESISLYHYPTTDFLGSFTSLIFDEPKPIGPSRINLSLKSDCVYLLNSDELDKDRLNLEFFRSGQAYHQSSASPIVVTRSSNQLTIELRRSPVLLQFYGHPSQLDLIRDCFIPSRKIDDGFLIEEKSKYIGEIFLVSEKRFSIHVLTGILFIALFIALVSTQNFISRAKDNDDIVRNIEDDL